MYSKSSSCFRISLSSTVPVSLKASDSFFSGIDFTILLSDELFGGFNVCKGWVKVVAAFEWDLLWEGSCRYFVASSSYSLSFYDMVLPLDFECLEYFPSSSAS